MKLKTTRAVTHRRYGVPAVILEGKWLTTKYKLRIGDVVDIEYLPKEIRFRKNSLKSNERQAHLREKEELRRKRIYGIQTSTNESIGAGSAEASQGKSSIDSE